MINDKKSKQSKGVKMTKKKSKQPKTIIYLLVFITVVVGIILGIVIYSNIKDSNAVNNDIAVTAGIPRRITVNHSSAELAVFLNQIGERISINDYNKRSKIENQACIGEKGVSGARVQLLYVSKSNEKKFNQDSSKIANIAAGVDSILMVSAKKQGAEFLTRWEYDSRCAIKVTNVTLDKKSFYEAMEKKSKKDPLKMISILKSKGFNKSNRKYMVFVKSKGFKNTCGFDFMPRQDSRPGAENKNNKTSYQIINSNCWLNGNRDQNVQNAGIMLVHALGGPQSGSPHALSIIGKLFGQSAKNRKFVYNVKDKDDLLTYWGNLNVGVEANTACVTSPWNISFIKLDCGNDDYFSAIKPTSGYLKDHWNIANNRFIQILPSNNTKAKEEAIRQAKLWKPPSGTACASVITPAGHTATGAKYTFSSACIPPGWEKE